MLHLCTTVRPVDTEHFVVGVNYWPRTVGVDLWKRFDVDAVEEDFALLSEHGIHFARVFLLVEDFQPTPDAVRCSALAHLLELCDAAAAESIKLELMFFDGNLHNTSSDPQARGAALQLVRAIARSVGGHPALSAYNLGHEAEFGAAPDCQTEAYAWFSELKEAIFELDPHHPVTFSLGGRNLTENSVLRVDRAFENLDYCTIDRESLTADVQGADKTKVALFNCALAMALSNKPTMLEEWDTLSAQERPDESPNDDQLARYAETLLPQLVELGARGTFLWWFSDTLQTATPHFRGRLYGLFDDDGNLRPHGKVLSRFARSKPRVNTNPGNALRVKLSAEQFYAAPKARLQGIFEEFVHA